MLWPLVTVAHCFSRWLTVLVTIHRYIAVCLPHKAAVYCTKSRALKQVTIYLLMFPAKIPLESEKIINKKMFQWKKYKSICISWIKSESIKKDIFLPVNDMV